ncbi:serpin family protein [Blastococcus sp. Marseille-P5729]|uniref:serpin family protein n=1 Tax=Blastococcus sp. Marseille-P5729 TaxID=2086582 RepID=UPI00131C0D8B|nr:serpin family protein [Blastococcus sp. Marseille-P5729]
MRMYSRRAALGLGGAVLLAALAACGEDSSSPPSSRGGQDADPDGPEVQLAADDPNAAGYQAAAAGFGLRMLAAALEEGKPNAVVSPLSISQCLALVAQGAADQTLDEMAAMLGSGSAEELRSGANADITAIAALKQATFEMANTSFTDESFEVHDEYAATVKQYFGVAPHTADFTDPETARTQINGWVAERTHDKIPELIGQGQITTDTRSVLVNALYMKARWSEQFDPDDTTTGDFTTEDGQTIDAKLMHSRRNVSVAQEPDGSIIFALPYEDESLQAVFVLPPEGAPLADVIDALASQPAGTPMLPEAAAMTDAELTVPRFEMRLPIDLKPALQSAGMLRAFEPEQADFSALSDQPTYLGFVQHEAWLKVGEKGTEGAAATAAGGEAGAAPGPSDEPLEIRLDRPFLFAVQEKTTGALAFLAAVLDPAKS